MPCLLRPTQTKNVGENWTNTKTVTFFRIGTQTLNFGHSYARSNDDLCKPIEIYIYVKKVTHLHVIPQQSTQNTTNLRLQTYEKNQWNFLLFNTGVDFSSRNNFANLVSFCKSFRSCKVYNSLNEYCLHLRVICPLVHFLCTQLQVKQD